MNTWGEDFESFSRLFDLVNASLSGQITPAEAAELDELVTRDPAARRLYLQIIDDSLNLRVWASGPDDAKSEEEKSATGGRKSEDEAASAANRPIMPPAPISDPSLHVPRSTFHISPLLTLIGVLGLAAAGVVAMVFWLGSTRAPQRDAMVPIAATPPDKSQPEPMATLDFMINAQWEGGLAPTGKGLLPRQRLQLVSGLAEITFHTGAKVILEGPADFTLGEGVANKGMTNDQIPMINNGTKPGSSIRNPKSEILNSCTLSAGRLTALVPNAAHGFTVHTPDGEVTDLGTEFGVFVRGQLSVISDEKNSGPTADSRQPTASSTEVHVFQGQVSITERAPLKSEITNQKSEILTAHQAALLTPTSVERLLTADAFRFRTDLLDGRPRKIVLEENFEAFPFGTSGRKMGEWKTVYTSGDARHLVIVHPMSEKPFLNGKGRGTPNEEPDEPTAELARKAQGNPPVGRRVAEFDSTARITKGLYPLMVRSFDPGVKLPPRGEVLVEFDIRARTPGIEPVVNCGVNVRLGPWIGLVNETPPPATEIIPWQGERWYRVRMLLSVADGRLTGVLVERSQWRGAEGWVRDITKRLTLPADGEAKAPGGISFSFAHPLMGVAGGRYWLDNVRVEVLAEK